MRGRDKLGHAQQHLLQQLYQQRAQDVLHPLAHLGSSHAKSEEFREGPGSGLSFSSSHASLGDCGVIALVRALSCNVPAQFRLLHKPSKLAAGALVIHHVHVIMELSSEYGSALSVPRCKVHPG